MRRLLKKLFSQFGLVCILLLLQVSVLFGITELSNFSSTLSDFLSFLMIALSVFVVLYILGKRDNPAFQMAWIVPILIFPVFGGIFYLILMFQKLNKRYHKRTDKMREDSREFLKQDESVLSRVRAQSPEIASLVKYMDEKGGYSMVGNTETRFLATGEEYWRTLLEVLSSAERYIYLEFFIIDEGHMWESVLDILKKKAAEGLDVRVMFDGVGSGSILPVNYVKILRSFGIRACEFGKFVPLLTVTQNNRDHRKIVAVDGVTAMTGGVNLADEYVNLYERFGHWLDSGLVVRGDAAYNFAAMFLQQWFLVTGEEVDYEQAKPTEREAASFKSDGGYVMPYAYNPQDLEKTGENVYLDIINRAQKYLYIATPYLILDSELTTALSFASKRGVDVRIVVPEIPDKWYAYEVSSSYIEQLVDEGVRVFKYTPGFIHSKNFVCDDRVAVVGSINLDYRSLYLHYECAAYMYRSAAVKEVRDDFSKLFRACEEVRGDREPIGFLRLILRSFLRLFAPLM